MRLEQSDPAADARAGPDATARVAVVSRPRDAASLILIDRTAGTFRVLVGRRNHRHAFMPNTYVFPGGRRDRSDSRTAVAADLDAAVAARLLARVPASTPPSRPRALAVAAVRETREETGLDIGLTDPATSMPSLAALRFFARAITPTHSSRRYDTRFFACFTDEADVDPDAAADSDELQDLRWIPIAPPPEIALPAITRIILSDLAAALAEDERLGHERPAPFYRFRSGKRIRELL